MSRTYILNLLFLINYMCKVSQFCNVGSHAQQMCHTPSLMDIYTGKVGENLETTQLTSSSLILKSTSYLEDEFQPHVGRTKRIFLLLEFLLLGFRRSLTSVDFGQRLVQTSWKLVGGSIFEGRTTWHKNRGQRVDRFVAALTFSLLPLRWLFRTALTFVELTWVDSSTGWRVVVTHAGLADQRRLCWLKHPVDRRNEHIHFSCFWFVFCKICLYVLSAFCLSNCMIAVRKVKLLFA